MPLVGLGLAVALSVFVWGGPKYVLRWEIDGKSVIGDCTARCRTTPTSPAVPEVAFSVELATVSRSLWAERTLRKLVSQGAELRIELLPVGVADIRPGRSDRGNAECKKVDEAQGTRVVTRQYLTLPLTTAEKVRGSRDQSQSRLQFDLLPRHPESKDEVSFSTTLVKNTLPYAVKTKNRAIVADGNVQRVRLEADSLGSASE
ncbi:hypothetical protein CQ047_02265 [Microbacterium sp. MYb72]|uniref:hypothetical protein n=1 Tax=Microbacterium sp. MYb72 TaxID=1848693 RepID=UPI000CFAA7C3|nr:hypothetical protein [Microbacterium sp. MYb72]PRB11899.1 hypothetical protein CQ047_02265 [Microbacterium sp. MYb72]